MNRIPITLGVIKVKPHSAEALWGLYPMIPNERRLFQDDFDIHHSVLAIKESQAHLVLGTEAKRLGQPSSTECNLDDRVAFVVGCEKATRDIRFLTKILVVMDNVVHFFRSHAQKVANFRNLRWEWRSIHKSFCCVGTVSNLTLTRQYKYVNNYIFNLI